jgi:L-ascorbate metabolism protein UlaG (beta-lactamase superfamily)
MGQAGFAIQQADRLVLIDPYLSDHLAAKYQGTDQPHVRLMPAPVQMDEFRGLIAVLCTHRHGDHMDPVALPMLAKTNPACRFIVPRAEMDHATAIEIHAIGMNAGETVTIDGMTVTAIASAHEQLQVNARGEHHFLGYIMRLAGKTVYHAGDCVPYAGLAERLADERIDVALLPVNGRGKGVAGNFTFEEAVAICRGARIPRLIVHHFGMFAFNTVSEEALVRQAAGTTAGVRVIVPCVGARVEV